MIILRLSAYNIGSFAEITNNYMILTATKSLQIVKDLKKESVTFLILLDVAILTKRLAAQTSSTPVGNLLPGTLNSAISLSLLLR